ncbi:hypothetical protein [Vibrio aestuarianus]|uniref:Uncharacterized protein n=1 Tax=Vibrio aestuarianus TaxID=28171 RepID=A0A9X4IT19_9VIBR|nr:hypothetical protein [Vibrio aestuarianus]MDE1241949.1 hypothetical protein [Vibrio aestuarianus]
MKFPYLLLTALLDEITLYECLRLTGTASTQLDHDRVTLLNTVSNFVEHDSILLAE